MTFGEPTWTASTFGVAEDYVELIEISGEGVSLNSPGRLGVSNATVTNTVQRLSRGGFVTYRGLAGGSARPDRPLIFPRCIRQIRK